MIRTGDEVPHAVYLRLTSPGRRGKQRRKEIIVPLVELLLDRLRIDVDAIRHRSDVVRVQEGLGIGFRDVLSGALGRLAQFVRGKLHGLHRGRTVGQHDQPQNHHPEEKLLEMLDAERLDGIQVEALHGFTSCCLFRAALCRPPDLPHWMAQLLGYGLPASPSAGSVSAADGWPGSAPAAPPASCSNLGRLKM